MGSKDVQASLKEESEKYAEVIVTTINPDIKSGNSFNMAIYGNVYPIVIMRCCCDIDGFSAYKVHCENKECCRLSRADRYFTDKSTFRVGLSGFCRLRKCHDPVYASVIHTQDILLDVIEIQSS